MGRYNVRKAVFAMPFSVRILRFFGILLLGVCALGVAAISWAYLIEPNLLFVRQVDYRIPQWNGRGSPLKVVVAGDLHLMPTAFDEVRVLRYVQRIMQLKPDLILLVGDYARGSSKNASMNPQKAAQLLQGGWKHPAGYSRFRATMISHSAGTTGRRN